MRDMDKAVQTSERIQVEGEIGSPEIFIEREVQQRFQA